MKKGILSTASILFFLMCRPVTAKQIILQPGQSYTIEETSVICVGPKQSEPITLSECQVWDDFSKKCLYEQKKYLFEGKECLEMCQHWDSFFETCHFQTKCEFNAANQFFIETTCMEFDKFKKKCIQEKQIILDKK